MEQGKETGVSLVGAPPARPVGVQAIALFKLAGSVLLFAIAAGAGLLTHMVGTAQLAHVLRIVRGDVDEQFLQRLLIQASLVAPRTLEAVSVGTGVYALLLLTEGIGLWLRQRWAEYFTVIVTASMIPLELYEVVQRPSPTNLLVLGSNVVIVIYLVTQLIQVRQGAE